MGIREIILLCICFVICAVALVRPKVGVLGYVWFSLMRPDILAFVEVKYPLSLIFAIATLIGTLPHIRHAVTALWSPTVRYLLLLQIPVGLSIIFAINPDLDMVRYTFYVRNLAVLFLIPVLIRSEEDLRQLLFVIALSLGVVGLKFGLSGLVSGGADFSSSSFGSMLEDNNFLALAFATVIPLAWYCRMLTTTRLLKAAFAAIIVGCMVAVVMSGSRGGSIALGTGMLLLLFRAKHKLAAGLFLCVGALGGIYLVQDAYVSRMSTLRAPEQDASAFSRVTHAKAALGVWEDHPLLGVGFGGMNYAAIASRYGVSGEVHVAHNTYLQVLADSGIFAFLLFCAAFFGAIRRLWRRSKTADTDSATMATALWISLTVFAVGATFYSCQRMDLLYILLMSAACYELITRNNHDHDAVELEGEDSGREIALSPQTGVAG